MVRKLKKLIYQLSKLIYWFPYTLWVLYMRKFKNAIVVRAWVRFNGYKLKHNNWGDDINRFLLEGLTGRQVVFVPNSRICEIIIGKRYSVIGSVISIYNQNNVSICGSGILLPEQKIRGKPLRIYSVRGPETRRVLLENGISCEEKYGDPALLLPLVYIPKIKKTQKYAIIPHINTKEDISDIVSAFQSAVIIDMAKYEEWVSVIDAICSSEYVISESLHGLIVAETYGIPCVWVEFQDHSKDWSFKFIDFFESIGKTNCESLKLYSKADLSKVEERLISYKKGDIDLKKILSYMPDFE